MIYILFILSIILQLFYIIFNIQLFNIIVLCFIIYLMLKNKTIPAFLLIIQIVVFEYIYNINKIYIYIIWFLFLYIIEKYIKNNDIIYINISIIFITMLEIVGEWDFIYWKLFLWHILYRLFVINIIFLILNRDQINEKL